MCSDICFASFSLEFTVRSSSRGGRDFNVTVNIRAGMSLCYGCHVWTWRGFFFSLVHHQYSNFSFCLLSPERQRLHAHTGSSPHSGTVVFVRDEETRIETCQQEIKETSVCFISLNPDLDVTHNGSEWGELFKREEKSSSLCVFADGEKKSPSLL